MESIIDILDDPEAKDDPEYAIIMMTDGDADFPSDLVKSIKNTYGKKIVDFRFVLFSDGANKEIIDGMKKSYGIGSKVVEATTAEELTKSYEHFGEEVEKKVSKSFKCECPALFFNNPGYYKTPADLTSALCLDCHYSC